MAGRTKDKRILVGEQLEKIDVMGQESEKAAVKWVQEEGENVKKKDMKFEADEMQSLSELSKRRFADYKERLGKTVQSVIINALDLPVGWQAHPFQDDKGVGIILWDKLNNKNYVRAFKPCNIPKFDLNAVSKICLQAQEFLDHQANLQNSIILPNSHN